MTMELIIKTVTVIVVRNRVDEQCSNPDEIV